MRPLTDLLTEASPHNPPISSLPLEESETTPLPLPELAVQKTSLVGKASPSRRLPSKSKPSIQMLPLYQGINLIDAVYQVVSENPGQILSTAKVTPLLCGELSGNLLSQAKQKINDALCRGAKQGRWQRVPGERGRYTLELRLLEPKTRES